MTQENLALSTNPSMELVESTPVGEIVTTDEVVVSQDETKSDQIVINRANLQAELDRLRREDNEFAQVYNRDIGNKAKSRYQPEIDALRRSNEAAQLAIRRYEFGGLDQETINEKFRTDPAFAKDYAEVMHANPQQVETPGFNPTEAKALVDSTLAFANRMLTPEQRATLQANIDSEKYDKDESGNPYTLYSWREGLERMQEDITYLAKGTVNTNPAPPVVTPLRTDTSMPDMTNGSSRGNNRSSLTMEQVRNMSWEEQFKRWPNTGDIERAIESGEITVPGLNA